MNKKPVQISVIILMAIMFIATIIITLVWKPSPDMQSSTSTAVIPSEISKIAITSLSAL